MTWRFQNGIAQYKCKPATKKQQKYFFIILIYKKIIYFNFH